MRGREATLRKLRQTPELIVGGRGKPVKQRLNHSEQCQALGDTTGQG